MPGIFSFARSTHPIAFRYEHRNRVPMSTGKAHPKTKPLSSDSALKPYTSQIRSLTWFFQSSFVGHATADPIGISIRAITKHRRILNSLNRLSPSDIRTLAAAFDYYPYHQNHLQLSCALGPWISVVLLNSDQSLRAFQSRMVRGKRSDREDLINSARTQIAGALERYRRAEIPEDLFLAGYRSHGGIKL